MRHARTKRRWLIVAALLQAAILLASCSHPAPASVAIRPRLSPAQLHAGIQYFTGTVRSQVGTDAAASFTLLDQRILDAQTVLIIYSYEHDKTPTIGAAALYMDDNQTWHTGSNTNQPFGPNESQMVKQDRLLFYATVATGDRLLPPFTVVYGRLYDQRISRVTVSFPHEALLPATVRDAWFWLIRPGVSTQQGLILDAYDAHGKDLGRMSP
jgi:hypothetical protein